MLQTIGESEENDPPQWKVVPKGSDGHTEAKSAPEGKECETVYIRDHETM
jgi:hypothetical protein